MNKKNEKGSFEKIQIIKPKENEKIIEIGKDLAINNNMNVLENKSPIKKKISKFPKKTQSSYKEKKYNYLLNNQNIINKSFHKSNSINIKIPEKDIKIINDENQNNKTSKFENLNSNNTRQNINYNINVNNNNNQNNIINILKLTKNIYEEEEHFKKDLIPKKLNSNNLSKFIKKSFDSSKNIIHPNLNIGLNANKRKDTEEINKSRIKKMSKSSKFIGKKATKKNIINLIQIEQKYNNDDLSSFNLNEESKNINNKTNQNNTINDNQIEQKKNNNNKFKKSKTFKKKKSKKKSSKKCIELKSNKSIKTIKSSNKSINQIFKLKNKKNEEVSKKNDLNNYNKKNKLFKFVNFLCCFNSKLNDTD